MRLLKHNTSIDFLSLTRRRIAVGISIVLVVASLIPLTTRGLNFGIDFTGGVLLEIGYPEDADLEKIRRLLGEAGFADVQVQSFGAATDVMLRLPPQPDADPDQIRDKLRNTLAADEPGQLDGKIITHDLVSLLSPQKPGWSSVMLYLTEPCEHRYSKHYN